MRDYPAFDWLRIVLASVVFWVHAASFPQLDFAGNFAVQVFFALSGFLIGGIILKMESSDFPRFFYNRVTRIWFPYVAAVSLLYITAWVKDGCSPYFWQSLSYDLTLTHNLFITKIPAVIQALPMQGTGAHFWSIAVEEQFYLMAPLLVVLTPIGKSWITWVFIAILASTYGVWYGSVSAGVLAVMLQNRFGDWHTRSLPTVLLLCAGILMSFMWASELVRYQYIAPILSIIIVLLLARPGSRSALGIWAGGISFPMYLNHWTGLFAANVFFAALPQFGRLLSDSAGFLFSLAVSAAAYKLIDKNIHLYRARLYTPKLGRIAMISAYALMAVGLVLGTLVIGPLSGPPTAS